MKRQWTDDELEAHFTLHSAELDLVGDSKTDHNLLGFAVLLKYFQYEGRFPSQKQDIPAAVTRHIAHQTGVATEELLAYDWDGRMIKNHRAAIRAFLGFRETTKQDEGALLSWLCQEVLGEPQQEDALLVAVYQHYQKQHIEPPTPDHLSRLLHTALHRFDEQFCASISQQLTPEVRARLDALLTTIVSEESSSAEVSTEATPDQEEAALAQRSRSVWQSLKQDAGQMSLEHTLEEIAKLERIEQFGLPATLFAQASPKLLQQYCQRVIFEEIHEICRHPDALRWTLLAAYCWLRRQDAKSKTEHVNRISYELCVLQTLRNKVRTKEVYPKQAYRFRNPDDDLPKDCGNEATVLLRITPPAARCGSIYSTGTARDDSSAGETE